jgi:hypothetical protein
MNNLCLLKIFKRSLLWLSLVCVKGESLSRYSTQSYNKSTHGLLDTHGLA